MKVERVALGDGEGEIDKDSEISPAWAVRREVGPLMEMVKTR